MTNRFTVAIDKDNQVAISGDLTMYSIEKDWLVSNKQVLQSFDKSRSVGVDLSAVNRIDSAGLAWLVNIVRDVKGAGFSLIFKNTPSELLNLAKISDAAPLLPLE